MVSEPRPRLRFAGLDGAFSKTLSDEAAVVFKVLVSIISILIFSLDLSSGTSPSFRKSSLKKISSIFCEASSDSSYISSGGSISGAS